MLIALIKIYLIIFLISFIIIYKISVGTTTIRCLTAFMVAFSWPLSILPALLVSMF